MCFSPERPPFFARARSGQLGLQHLLIQDCHNLCVDRLGKEYRLEVQCEVLDRKQRMVELLPPQSGL